LKRPEEIDCLREIYGPSVFIISAYSPRAARVNRLASQLAERQHENQSTAYRGKAEELITRDENEKSPFSQGVRKAYPLADLFVRTSSVASLRASIERFVDILFGEVWKTPTRDEQGMAFAALASFRSASPARQVGAAITDDAGRVLSVGTNEVAKAGGGQYWEGDSNPMTVRANFAGWCRIDCLRLRAFSGVQKLLSVDIVATMIEDSYEIITIGTDEVTLVAGDSDYVPAIEKLKKRGIPVHVVFWGHAARELKEVATKFINLDQYLDHLNRNRP
jgi:deoxycytidylate deaminase